MTNPQALRDLFERAVELSPGERPAFLDCACSADPGLREEVMRLLLACDRAGSLLGMHRSASAEPHNSVAEDAPPPLLAGTRLGPYVIAAPLGAGGMGTVYEALDARLDRTVAIKVLAPAMAANRSARHRLEQEARAAAALAHPHICTLLDIGRQDDIDFLVMEYLDGETLAARLRRDKLSLDAALSYAIDIADALDAAHHAGIVHRDLKPANIMLTKSGAKLLDFGLAKRDGAIAAANASSLPFRTSTLPGTIIGTIGYMAPEQFDGKPVDARADVFAFGVVLKEMLTGRPAVEGPRHTPGETIAQPEPEYPRPIDAAVRSRIEDLLQQCLEKDRNARKVSMAEARAQLLAARDLVGGADTWRRHAAWVFGNPRTLAGLSLAVALLAVAGASLSGLFVQRIVRPRPSTDQAPVQHTLTRVTFDAGFQTDPAFSPDGRFLAYASDKTGNFDIWVQPLRGGEAVRLTTSPAADTQPSWSPDGSTVVFRSERDGGGLYLVPGLGGPQRRLTDFGVYPAWSADGTRVRFHAHRFGPGAAALYTVSLTGEPPRRVLPEFTARGRWKWIEAFPDGRFSFLGLHPERGFGFFTVGADGAVTDSKIMSHVPPALNDLIHSGAQFVWNRTGDALLLSAETNTAVLNLWRVRVNPSTLEWSSVERLTTSAGRDLAPALSPDERRLAFSTAHNSDQLWRFPLDHPRHRVLEGEPLTSDAFGATASELSADGNAVVHTVIRSGQELGPTAPGMGLLSLWTTDLRTRKSATIVEGAQSPVWERDGRRIAYTKLRIESVDHNTGSQLTALAVARIGGNEQIVSSWKRESIVFTVASDWLADGSGLLACDGNRLMIWPVSSAAVAEPSRIVLARPGMRCAAKFSPNARWLAFVQKSDHSDELSLQVTDANGPPRRPSSALAPTHRRVYALAWGPDGKTLYFLTSPNGSFIGLWGIPFDPERGRPVGEPYSVADFDSPGFAISPATAWWPTLGVTARSVFLTMQTATGNLWMLDNLTTR